MKKRTNQNIIIIIGLVIAVCSVFYRLGSLPPTAGVPYEAQTISLVLDWNKYTLKAEKGLEGFKGPIMARIYGYMGMAAYEAGLPGFSGDFISMSSRFPKMKLPVAPSSDSFNLALSLNECYATILGLYFVTSPHQDKEMKQELRAKWESEISKNMDTSVIRISKNFGREVAVAVFEWSATDSLAHRANHHNYDRNYIPPTEVGKWVTSPEFPMPALLPYWGNVRPFIIHTESYLAKPLPADTAEANPLFHNQALELISLSSPLSPENQWIAEFWNDDLPGVTYTPPGHWISIVNQIIEKENPPIEKALETYMKTGFALGDAIIACFYSKYKYNFERPETYIRREINPSWRSYSPSPPFPSYPSGHAMLGSATAAVLSDLYGNHYKMMDCTHAGIDNIALKPRQFGAFDDMAKESTMSRLLLGVHWRIDCEEGLRLGSLIGNEVSHIQLENKLTE